MPFCALTTLSYLAFWYADQHPLFFSLIWRKVQGETDQAKTKLICLTISMLFPRLHSGNHTAASRLGFHPDKLEARDLEQLLRLPKA